MSEQWKIVPIEPTDDMMEAMRPHMQDADGGYIFDTVPEMLRAAVKAAIAAAPEPFRSGILIDPCNSVLDAAVGVGIKYDPETVCEVLYWSADHGDECDCYGSMYSEAYPNTRALVDLVHFTRLIEARAALQRVMTDVGKSMSEDVREDVEAALSRDGARFDVYAALLAEFNDTALADRVMKVIKGQR